jgi:uncharacterized protein (TIGR02300 family)
MRRWAAQWMMAIEPFAPEYINANIFSSQMYFFFAFDTGGLSWHGTGDLHYFGKFFMTKEKRGTKRLCESCENKFYDLGRDPIICPICETTFVPETPKPKPRPKPKAAPAPAPVATEEKVKEAVKESKTPAASSEPPAVDPEFASLEEAAAEEDVDEDAKLADLGDDETDIPPDENKDAFLEVDEDEAGAAVSGIVGGASDSKGDG